MNTMIRTKMLLILMVMSSTPLLAQNKEELAVIEAVAKLNQAMLDANNMALDQLTSPSLSYGHSNGLIEDKDAYITSIIDGTFRFTSIDVAEQTISISDNIAIVRHKFSAGTANKGQEPGNVKLSVLQVWQKHKGKWLLLARHATKIM